MDLKPEWEEYLKRGLVSPRKIIVLDSSPDAWKYNKEKCALNVLEEEKLVKGWKRAQEMEHAACVDLNAAHDTLVDAKKSLNFTIGHWKSLSAQFGDAQDEFAKFMMVVGDRKSHIEDVELVRDIEHNIRHAKFDAVDILKYWLSENRARKCFRCDTVFSDTSTLTPSYSDMRGRFGSLPSLLSDRYSMISNFKAISAFKGNRVEEKGGRFGSQRAHLRTHF